MDRKRIVGAIAVTFLFVGCGGQASGPVSLQAQAQTTSVSPSAAEHAVKSSYRHNSSVLRQASGAPVTEVADPKAAAEAWIANNATTGGGPTPDYMCWRGPKEYCCADADGTITCIIVAAPTNVYRDEDGAIETAAGSQVIPAADLKVLAKPSAELAMDDATIDPSMACVPPEGQCCKEGGLWWCE
jgi:hypothetical protein